MKGEKRKEYILISPDNKKPLKAKKRNRNDMCSCGSGKKQKRCCGNKTEYYLT